MLAIAAIIVWQGRSRLSDSADREAFQRQVPIPAAPIVIQGAASRGAASARVAMIEYADFECSFCARFAQEIEPELRRDYVDNGRVLFVFKHFPLPMHKQAPAAAEAAWCAARQGKFWDMHERLFGSLHKLQQFDAQTIADDIGLDRDRYKSCQASGEARHYVQADRDEGKRLKVAGTPVFFFGGIMPDRRVRISDALMGAKSIDEFKLILDRLLRQA